MKIKHFKHSKLVSHYRIKVLIFKNLVIFSLNYQFLFYIMKTNIYNRVKPWLKQGLLSLGLVSAGYGISNAQVSGYIFSQTTGTYNSISSTGLHIGGATSSNGVDGVAYSVTLPIPFQFNGANVTTCFPNTNGGLTFGTTSTGSTLINTTVGTGALAPMNRDLYGWYYTSGTTTSGSNVITNVAHFHGIQIGDTLGALSGIPSNTTIVAYDELAGTITMSNNATSTSASATVRYPTAKIYTQTIGTAPNRTFIIEWKGFEDYNTSATNNSTYLNFQVHLEETTNKVHFVYGPCHSLSTTARTNQIGIRGATTSDYNNRTSSTSWTATTAGTSNSATVTRTNTIMPPVGLTFTWTPPTCLGPTNVNVTNVTTNTANLSWTASTSSPANGYEYYYSTTNTTPSSSVTPSGVTAAGVTTANLTGLTPNTTYYVWVRSICSSSDQSNWSPAINFRTELVLPTPYNQGFATTTTPDGFSLTGFLIGSVRGVTGNPSNNIYYNLYSGATSATFTTVNVGPVSSSDVFTFDYKTSLYSSPYDAVNAGSGYFKVSVSTNFGATYTQIDSVSNPTVNTWLPKTYSLAPYAGSNVKIKIEARWVAQDFDIAFDNLFIGTPPTCVVPTNLTTSAISTNGATIGWTAPTPAPANGYEYYYSTSSTAPTATTTPSGTTAAGVTSANLASLTANTTYYYWVRSICAPSDKSDWTATSSFYTGHCIPQALTTSTSYYVSSVVTSGAAVDLNYSANTAVPYVNATTTILQTYPSNSFTFTIAPSSGTNYYYLWVDWNNDLDFNDAGETIFATTSYTASHTGTITTPASQATGSYRMRVSNSFIGANTPCGPATYGNYVDFTLVIAPPPTCIAPTNLSVNAITSTGATINWTPSTTTVNVGYDYYISTTNVTPAATATPTGSVAATATSATDNSLSPATTYHYWVRSNCAATDQSAWAYGGTFTTLCATFSAPFVENFNNGVLPNCWTNENNTNATSTYLKWLFTGNMGYGTTGNGGKTSGTFAWVDASSPYNLGDSVILSTPAINLATLVAPQVGFDWFKRHATSSTGAASTYDNNRLSLDIKNINSNTWTTLFSDTSNANFWRSEDINIPANFLGQTVQFRLVVNKNTNGNGYFYDDLAIDSFRVVEGPCTPPVVALGNDTSFCDGLSLTLDAGAGTGYTYAWSTGDTTQTIDATLTGTYSVTVDNGQCSAVDTIVVSVIPNPIVDLGNDTTDCVNGGPITLTAGTSTTDIYAWSNGDNTASTTATVSGSYSVVVTNAAGCQGTDTINVVMGQVPSVGGITATGTSPNFNFSANSPSNVTTYEWNFGDGNTSNAENPTHTYTPTGSDEALTVTLIVSNECGADTVSTTVTVKGNSINNLNLNHQALKLYPNPALEKVTVENASTFKMKKIVVFNMLGQEVLTENVNNTKLSNIDISTLNAGMYQVRIEFEEGSVSRKLEILK